MQGEAPPHGRAQLDAQHVVDERCKPFESLTGQEGERDVLVGLAVRALALHEVCDEFCLDGGDAHRCTTGHTDLLEQCLRIGVPFRRFA